LTIDNIVQLFATKKYSIVVISIHILNSRDLSFVKSKKITTFAS